MNHPGKNLIRNVVLEYMKTNGLKRSQFWQMYASDIIRDHSHFYKWIAGKASINDEKAGRLLVNMGYTITKKAD